VKTTLMIRDCNSLVRCSRHSSTLRLQWSNCAGIVNKSEHDRTSVDEDEAERLEQRSCISHRMRHITALDAALYGNSTRNCQDPSLQHNKTLRWEPVFKVNIFCGLHR